MAILAIDVGNSRAKFGVWLSDPSAGEAADFLTAVPLLDGVDLASELNNWLKSVDRNDIDQLVIAGSNPQPVQQLLNSWAHHNIQVTHIQSYHQVPLTMKVQQPETVGIDRLLTAVAVRARQIEPAAAIVVDAGTATTVNLTTSDGAFRGGAILPGMRMSARALHDYTAALPLIDADTLFEGELPDDASSSLQMPGRHTTSAIQNGIFWGHLGSIKELISHLVDRLPDFESAPSKVSVTMTGGGSRQLAALIPNAIYEDSLALTGLATLAPNKPLGERKK